MRMPASSATRSNVKDPVTTSGCNGAFALTEFGITPEFIAALYEAALEPSSLKPLAQLFSEFLRVENLCIWLSDQNVVTEFGMSNDVAKSVADQIRPNDSIAQVSVDADVAATIGRFGNSEKLRLSEADAAWLDLALPHFKCAIQFRRGHRSRNWPQPQAMVSDTLAFGAVICDRQSQIIHANSAAQALAAAATGILIRPRMNKLGTATAVDSQKLAQMIESACRDSEAGSMVLSNQAGAPDIVILVTPLPRENKSNLALGDGYALVAISTVSGRATFDAARLAELFRLSPAQASLALAIYEGNSFEDIASQRNVKISTLRSHLNEVFIRTGANGMRDLVRLLGIIPPLR